MNASTSISLTQRLVDRYLMFGLSGVFLCVAAGMLLAWQESYFEWSVAAVALPLVSLLCGAFVMRRTVGVSAAIEEQLRHAGRNGTDFSAIRPLPDSDPTALVWNALVAQLHDRRCLVALDAKLAGSFDQVEQQRWLSLFNSLSDGIAVCDGGEIVLLANNAIAAHLRIPATDNLVGSKLHEVLDRVARTSAVLDSAMVVSGRGGVREIFLGATIADGVLRVVRTPLVGEAFGKNGAMWVVKDVTQQKLAERMRTQFVATATHELRTPLTNIRAYSELLADEQDISLERQKEFCNIIGSEVSRLARFVDQMLNVSQMEAGGLTIARHDIDLQRLLSDVMDAVKPQTEKKGLAFKAAIPPKLPKIRLDKDKITAALVNLLGNAVKYTLSGEVVLSVDATADQIVFHVDDTGIGIAPSELEQLGTRFFRSADERVRAINGSGLGLAFAQEVARLHGGRLAASSELNKGSRFSLILPVV